MPDAGAPYLPESLHFVTLAVGLVELDTVLLTPLLDTVKAFSLPYAVVFNIYGKQLSLSSLSSRSDRRAQS